MDWATGVVTRNDRIWPPFDMSQKFPRVKNVEYGDYRVKKVRPKELIRKIFAEKRELPMVVDFYATWCGPCIPTAQNLEQIAVEYDSKVEFLKVDTDEEYEIAHLLELRGLPTLMFFSTDVEKDVVRTEGLLSSPVMRDIIEKELGVERLVIPDYLLGPYDKAYYDR